MLDLIESQSTYQFINFKLFLLLHHGIDHSRDCYMAKCLSDTQ